MYDLLARRHADLVICLGTSLQIEPSALLPATCLLRAPPSAAYAKARPLAALSRTLRKWSREREKELKRRRRAAAASATAFQSMPNNAPAASLMPPPKAEPEPEPEPEREAPAGVAVAGGAIPKLETPTPPEAEARVQDTGSIQTSAVRLTCSDMSDKFSAGANGEPANMKPKSDSDSPNATHSRGADEEKKARSNANAGASAECERHLVIVNLQETAFDAHCSVRLFARIETLLPQLLACLLSSSTARQPDAACEPAGGGRVDGSASASATSCEWPTLDEAALARLARGHEPAQCEVCAGEQAALAARHLPATVTRNYSAECI